MPPAILLDRVEKSFGHTRALKGLDLMVPSGEIHGFLGPNGAGKTVTLRILLGLYRHDAGTVQVLGSDPWNDSVALHRRIAYVPGEVTLWPNLTGGEVIEMLGELRSGLDPTLRDQLIEEFRLDPTKRCRNYSKGNRQKVVLISALSCAAELFLFDEPTSGLDPLMESVFQQHVKRLRENGSTVLLSSHILVEVEQLCDRVTIIGDGTSLETGTLDELRHLRRTHLSVRTRVPVTALTDLPGLHEVQQHDCSVEVSVDPQHLSQLLAHLATFDITNLVSTPPSLEELFMRHYTGESDHHVAASPSA